MIIGLTLRPLRTSRVQKLERLFESSDTSRTPVPFFPRFYTGIHLADILLYLSYVGNTDRRFAQMKGGLGRVVRSVVAGAFAAALICQLAGQAGAVEGREITVHSGKIDLTHGVGAEPIDQVDIIMTFTNTEAADGHICEKATDDPVVHGLAVALQEGYCGTGAPAAYITIPSFRPTYKGSPLARFEGRTVQRAVVDGLLRTLPTPARTCGMWSLTLDAVPLNLSRISHNPVALSVRLPDGSRGCVTVTNALIDQ
jgi:hypothetical protein